MYRAGYPRVTHPSAAQLILRTQIFILSTKLGIIYRVFRFSRQRISDKNENYAYLFNAHDKGLSSKDSRARLACVRHAASVHPEPGSNSQIKVVYLLRLIII